jgi:hypothetical protein
MQATAPASRYDRAKFWRHVKHVQKVDDKSEYDPTWDKFASLLGSGAVSHTERVKMVEYAFTLLQKGEALRRLKREIIQDFLAAVFTEESYLAIRGSCDMSLQQFVVIFSCNLVVHTVNGATDVLAFAKSFAGTPTNTLRTNSSAAKISLHLRRFDATQRDWTILCGLAER